MLEQTCLRMDSAITCKDSFCMSELVYLFVFFLIQSRKADVSSTCRCNSWVKLLLASSLCPLNAKPCRARNRRFWRIFWNILFSAFCFSCSLLNRSSTSLVCFGRSRANTASLWQRLFDWLLNALVASFQLVYPWLTCINAGSHFVLSRKRFSNSTVRQTWQNAASVWLHHNVASHTCHTTLL